MNPARLQNTFRPRPVVFQFALAVFSVLAGMCVVAASTAPIVTPLSPRQSSLRSPTRVATDADSRLYVCDSVAGKVVVFDAFGRPFAVKEGLGQPLGIAVDAASNIYLGDAETGAVNVFDRQWNLLRQLGRGPGEFQLPGYIALATNNGIAMVFVSDGPAHTVKAYRDGTLIGQFGAFGIGPAQFNFPAGLCASPGGELFVVDQGNDRVQVLDLNGNFLRRFTLQPSPTQSSRSGRAQGITCDGQGRLYVADTFQGHVKVFDTSGAFLGCIGGYGGNSGQTRSPGGLAVDDLGRLWIASANNCRVDGFGLDCSWQLTVSPASQTIGVGTTVSLTAGFGCAESLTCQWLKNGAALADEANLSGATNSTLTLTDVTVGDSGNYSVQINGAAGVMTSPEASLTVVSPPSISVNPISRTAAQGTTVGFFVTAQGNALEYQWLQNGIPLAGATQSMLWLTNVQPFAAGSYSVRVSNAAGDVNSSAAMLTLILRPVITEPPLDLIAPVGATVALNVTAVGSAPLTYQWSRNGLNLSGQTRAQLVLSNVTATANGVYAVRVLNSAGDTNATARFAVNAPVNVLVARNGAGDFVLTWNNPFYGLQAAPTLKGPWQSVSDTSPLTLPANVMLETPEQYFRLVRR